MIVGGMNLEKLATVLYEIRNQLATDYGLVDDPDLIEYDDNKVAIKRLVDLMDDLLSDYERDKPSAS